MKNPLFMLLLAGLLLMSCHREPVPEIEKGTAVVAGHIDSFSQSGDVVTLISVNALYSKRYSILPDEKGNFLFRIEMLHPHNVGLRFSNGYVAFFLHPSDSLFFEMDEKRFREEDFPLCEITGNNPVTATEVMNYQKFRGAGSFSPSFAGEPSVTEYLGQMRRHIASEDSLAGLFIRKYHPGREFRHWVKKNILYSTANYLVDYQYHHFVNKTPIEGNLFDTELFPVDDDGAMVTSLYGYHLWHYSTNRYIQKDSVVMRLLDNEKKSEAYRLCLENIVVHEKAGLSRDIMCYRILEDLFKTSFEDYLKVWQDSGRFIINKTIRSLLNDKIQQHERAKKYPVTRLDPVSDSEKEVSGDFWSVLRDRYKGKVIYVDLWATWCGPCLAEIPAAAGLHAYFKDKPVVFVNICLSSEKSEWGKKVKDMHIDGENYFFDREQTNLFLGRLKDFQGYPTYMIIDRDGNIVDFHAPRPSSGEEIRKRLEKLTE